MQDEHTHPPLVLLAGQLKNAFHPTPKVGGTVGDDVGASVGAVGAVGDDVGDVGDDVGDVGDDVGDVGDDVGDVGECDVGDDVGDVGECDVGDDVGCASTSVAVMTAIASEHTTCERITSWCRDRPTD